MRPLSLLIIPALCATFCAPLRAQQPTPESEPPEDQVLAPAKPTQPAAPAPAKPPAPGDPLANVAGSLEAKAVFRQMYDRFRQTQSLSFHSRVVNTGSLAARAADTEVTVLMRRPTDKPGMWQVRVTGTSTRKPEDPPSNFDVVWGPAGTTWLDHEHKKLFSRAQAAGAGPLVQTALTCVPTEFLEKSPFTKQAAAQLVTLDGTEQIDGVECNVLTFETKSGVMKTKLWIGVADHLLRKHERSNSIQSYASSTTIEFSDVRANEPTSDDQFVIEAPEGYERATPPLSAALNRPRPTGTPPTPTDGSATPAPQPGGEQAPATPITPEVPPPPPPPPPAPDFDLATPTGEKVSLQKLRGSTVVLYFWGTWSLPGQAGIEDLQTIQDELAAKSVRALAIAVRERTPQAPAEFLKSASRTVTLLVDGDSAAAAYGVSVYPTWIVIDPAGVKAGSVEGYKKATTAEKVRALIAKARGEPAEPPKPAAAKPDAPPESKPEPKPDPANTPASY